MEDRSSDFRAVFYLLLLLFLSVALSSPTANAQSGPQPVDFHSEPLTISSGTGKISFRVEIARTPDQRSIGLMFRKSMAENAGMLFDFDRTRMVSMWMRNTYLPLDMLFIRRDGTIASIAENTEPQSDSVISSGEPVRYVLEINAFMAGELGISVGDRVEHPVIAGNHE